MRGQVAQHRGSEHLRRVLVLRHRSGRFTPGLLLRLLYPLPEVGRGHREHVPEEVGDESGVDLRPVGILDRTGARDVGQRRRRRRRKERQLRPEQEEADPPALIESQYPGEDAERRVVNHDIILLVVIGLIVAARPERTHYVTAFDVHLLPQPSEDGLVHLNGRVAVIRGQFRLELLRELAVIILADLPLNILGLRPDLLAEEIQLLYLISHKPTSFLQTNPWNPSSRTSSHPRPGPTAPRSSPPSASYPQTAPAWRIRSSWSGRPLGSGRKQPFQCRSRSGKGTPFSCARPLMFWPSSPAPSISRTSVRSCLHILSLRPSYRILKNRMRASASNPGTGLKFAIALCTL